jgi:hypothetical protein
MLSMISSVYHHFEDHKNGASYSIAAFFWRVICAYVFYGMKMDMQHQDYILNPAKGGHADIICRKAKRTYSKTKTMCHINSILKGKSVSIHFLNELQLYAERKCRLPYFLSEIIHSCQVEKNVSIFY